MNFNNTQTPMPKTARYETRMSDILLPAVIKDVKLIKTRQLLT
jgi:hypothetical protein